MTSQFDYIISKSDTNTVAWNTATASQEFSNADARTTFNSVIDALDSAGGGSCLVKKGTYTIATNTGSIGLKDNQTWVGEDRDLTIIKGDDSGSSSNQVWKRTGSQLTNFKMMDITTQTNGTSACLYTSGSIDCYFNNCVFKFTAAAQSSRFIVFFDAVNNTFDNEYLIVNHCHLEGDTAGQDMFGSGNMYGCNISNNIFRNGGGQGIGINTSVGSQYNKNYFFNIATNPIGMEAICEGNEVNGNICISCNGAIKLSQLESETNKSISNSCCNNIVEYGNKGVEAGWSEGDIISNNIFRRLRSWAIKGTISGATISGNQFYEINYDNTKTVLKGSSTQYNTGGIVLSNNANFTTPRRLSINNNYFYTSRKDFTIPTGYINGGLVKRSYAGGVLIDSNNKYNIVVDSTNIFDNTYSSVVNKGLR